MQRQRRVTSVETAWGNLVLETTAHGVCGVRFGPRRPDDADWDDEGNVVAGLAAVELREYLEGKRRVFTVPVDISHTPAFHQKVYRALLTVPFGCTVSYGDLAAAAGSPSAARAVGTAMAHNRIFILVPCHRVIAAGGRMGGWSGPEGLKERLHLHEGIRLVKRS